MEVVLVGLPNLHFLQFPTNVPYDSGFFNRLTRIECVGIQASSFSRLEGLLFLYSVASHFTSEPIGSLIQGTVLGFSGQPGQPGKETLCYDSNPRRTNTSIASDPRSGGHHSLLVCAIIDGTGKGTGTGMGMGMGSVEMRAPACPPQSQIEPDRAI